MNGRNLEDVLEPWAPTRLCRLAFRGANVPPKGSIDQKKGGTKVQVLYGEDALKYCIARIRPLLSTRKDA